MSCSYSLKAKSSSAVTVEWTSGMTIKLFAYKGGTNPKVNANEDNWPLVSSAEHSLTGRCAEAEQSSNGYCEKNGGRKTRFTWGTETWMMIMPLCTLLSSLLIQRLWNVLLGKTHFSFTDICPCRHFWSWGLAFVNDLYHPWHFLTSKHTDYSEN